MSRLVDRSVGARACDQKLGVFGARRGLEFSAQTRNV
jgi:hypothetical protein